MEIGVSYQGKRDSFLLNHYPVFIKNVEALFQGSINYNTTFYNNDDRVEVDNFYFGGNEVELELQINSINKSEIINKLDDAFTYDRANKYPARLYVNGQYIYCYIVSSSPQYFNMFNNFEVIKYKVLVLSKWIFERRFDFPKNDDSIILRGHKYPMRYPFSYKMLKTDKFIENQHSDFVKAKISFFGPVTNPAIEIGNNTYGVTASLLENERIEIDPFKKTVVKVTAVGDEINMINERSKVNSVFEKIAPGTHLLFKNGAFAVEIITFEERCNLKWK